MSKHTLKIATRKSPLALWQANHVADLLKKHWPDLEVELLPMVTSGDQFLKDKLQSMGGKGLFVKELEEALLDQRADLAVHSMKDVPAELPEGLMLAAICERDNPFDVLVTLKHQNLANLPQRSRIGTSSLRRQSQLLSYRPDFQIQSLRGNINTRLSKLEAGEFNAIVLAAAGLERMGFQEVISERIDVNLMLPACGQGALGIECRSQDKTVLELLQPLNHSPTALCVATERQVNARLGGNCHVPLAVFCQPSDKEQITLSAKVLSEDGKIVITDTRSGEARKAIDLANNCASALLEKGAAQLLGLKP